MNTKFTKPAAFLAAGLIATLAAVTVQKAYATTTVPNASRTTYTIASGAVTPSFAIPTTGNPVSVMANQTTLGYRSIGQTVLMYSGGSSPLLFWDGIDSAQSTGYDGGGDSALRSGYTNNGNIVVLDHGWGGTAALESVLDGAGNASRLQIRNSGGLTVTNVVVMMW
ncbi:MAG: hypothetical protein QOJ65_261 [Fimbriimonadaceae bacterium]|nr:hypothetical protein [Fimbriimonadaceae bacterium]